VCAIINQKGACKMKFYLRNGDHKNKWILIENKKGWCTMQIENGESIIHGWAGEFVVA